MKLKVICADLPAPPLFWRDEKGERHGYEADLARAIGQQLGRETEFIYRNWADFYPALDKGEGDLLLCGQGISDLRKTYADFTAPYAVFDEAVMVLRGSPIKTKQDLKGKRVAAIAGSLNMALAETFDGCIRVPFDGNTADVMGDMVKALRAGEVDAFIDDDVALVPLAEQPDLAIAFSCPTHNPWGALVKKGQGDWLAQVDNALATLKQNGTLKQIWQRWMPSLAYPF